MVRGLNTDVTPVSYTAELSGNRGCLTLTIMHGETGSKVESNALYHSTAMTTNAIGDLPLHGRIKNPLIAAMESGIVRSVRHGMKGGTPALSVQVPFRDENGNDAAARLKQLCELWNSTGHSELAVTLPAVLTNHPSVIIQCPRPLFCAEASPKRKVQLSSTSLDDPRLLNDTGRDLAKLLMGSRGAGMVELSEATLGVTEIAVHANDPSQLDYLLVNPCIEAFKHFGLRLAFAS